MRALPRQHPVAQVGELETDERRHRVADVPVAVRERAEELVVGWETAQECEFADGAEPVLLRMRVTAVADVGALALDRHARPVPPQPAILVGVRPEVARGDEPLHRRREQTIRVWPPEQVEPRPAVPRDRPHALHTERLGETRRPVVWVARMSLACCDGREMGDGTSHGDALGRRRQFAPQVAQRVDPPSIAHRDDEGTLADLRQAEVREHVYLPGHGVPHRVQRGAEVLVVVREVPANELAGVLHHEDRRTKRGHELARALDQPVASVVAFVVLAVRPAEPRAWRARDQHVEFATPEAHVAHELLGRVGRDVCLPRREADVRLVRGVALQRPHAAARLADLRIHREHGAKRLMASEAETHPPRAGEQIPEGERRRAIHRVAVLACRCMRADVIRCVAARTP